MKNKMSVIVLLAASSIACNGQQIGMLGKMVVGVAETAPPDSTTKEENPTQTPPVPSKTTISTPSPAPSSTASSPTPRPSVDHPALTIALEKGNWVVESYGWDRPSDFEAGLLSGKYCCDEMPPRIYWEKLDEYPATIGKFWNVEEQVYVKVVKISSYNPVTGVVYGLGAIFRFDKVKQEWIFVEYSSIK